MARQLGIDNKQIATEAKIQTFKLCGDPAQNNSAEGAISLSTGVDPTAAQLNVSSLVEGMFYWHTVDQKWRCYVTGSAWADFASVAGSVSLDTAYNGGSAITVDTAAISMTNAHATIDTMTVANSHATGSGDGLQITMSGATPTGHAINVDVTGATSASNGVDVNISQVGGTGHCLNLAHAGTGKLINATNFNVTPAGLVTSVGLTSTGVVGITVGGANVPITLTDTGTGNAIAATNFSITKAGAATFAQALTVSAGGVQATGNSVITGDLQVTGSLTFGGSWTVVGTLTADEYVFGSGTEPAGTVTYAVYDGTSTTINVPTGKRVDIAINGTDEFNFSATSLDMNANHLDNCGYVILNEVTLPVATECFIGRDNTGDTNINALTGKGIYATVAKVDYLNILEAGTVINEGGLDHNFRIETNTMQYAIYSDGNKDCLVLGSNADGSDTDKLVLISRSARANTAATPYADFVVTPAGAITTSGVTATVASVYISEPNITIGGDSVTVAASLYVAGAPTEGGSNYAIFSGGSIGLIADATDLAIGASADCLLRWSTADADNHALALGLGASLAFHVCQAADIATDWNVAAASNPTLYIHGAATPATEYIAFSTDETDAHANAVGANWKFEIGGTAELTLAANALNLVDSILYGSAADGGNLILHSTSHATKGYVGIADAHEGLKIGGTADRAGTVGDNALHIFNGAAAPAGALANGISLYSEGGECKVLDAAGNSTTLSPHTPAGDYIIHSYAAKTNQTVTIFIEGLANALIKKFPELKEYVKYQKGNVNNLN